MKWLVSIYNDIGSINITFMFLYILCAQLDLKFCRESVIIFEYSKAVSMGREPQAEPFRMRGLEPIG